MRGMTLPQVTFVLFALFGAAFGSFGNVLIHRTAKGQSVRGRSVCPHCRSTLAWFDLVPIVSYVVLRGRCRSCRASIALTYPFVELITAALFLLAYLLTPDDPLRAAMTALVFFGLLLVCVFDLRHQQIPDLFTAIVAVGAIGTTLHAGTLVPALQGGLVVFLWFGIQWVVSRGRFVGSGDIFLGASLGLWLGLASAIAMLFLSYIIGAAVAVYLLATGRARLKDTQLPFGPFLAAGAVLAFIGTDNPVLAGIVLAFLAMGIAYLALSFPRKRDVRRR